MAIVSGRWEATVVATALAACVLAGCKSPMVKSGPKALGDPVNGVTQEALAQSPQEARWRVSIDVDPEVLQTQKTDELCWSASAKTIHAMVGTPKADFSQLELRDAHKFDEIVAGYLSTAANKLAKTIKDKKIQAADEQTGFDSGERNDAAQSEEIIGAMASFNVAEQFRLRYVVDLQTLAGVRMTDHELITSILNGRPALLLLPPQLTDGRMGHAVVVLGIEYRETPEPAERISLVSKLNPSRLIAFADRDLLRHYEVTAIQYWDPWPGVAGRGSRGWWRGEEAWRRIDHCDMLATQQKVDALLADRLKWVAKCDAGPGIYVRNPLGGTLMSDKPLFHIALGTTN